MRIMYYAFGVGGLLVVWRGGRVFFVCVCMCASIGLCTCQHASKHFAQTAFAGALSVVSSVDRPRRRLVCFMRHDCARIC